MKNKKLNRWRQLAVCAAIFLSAPFLMAQSPVGSEFLVNPESPGLQHEPDLQFDSDGALWFTWLDSMGPEAEFNRVEARAVSSHGELGPVLDLVTTSGVPITPALYPLVVPTQGGGVHLFYTRQTEDGIAHVYGQQFDTAGHALGERTILTPPSPVSAIGLAVAPLPEGGFSLMTSGFLCFTCPGPTRGSIFARLLAADGSPASTYFRAPRKSETASSGVRGMAVDGPGNITFVWSPLNGDPDTRDYADIHGRRFSSAGEPIGPEFVVNTTLRGTQFGPSVAADEDGDFVVVWQTRFPGGLLRSIFGQRFSKTGQKAGPEFRVNEERFEKDFAPSVAMDREGNFVVAWQSFSRSPTRARCGQVRARLYRRDGTPAGPEFPVAPGYAACGEEPKVAFGPNGVFALVWSVDRGYSPETGTDFDVHAARFSVSPALP